MIREDLRSAFTELRKRTGLPVDQFAALLGYRSATPLERFEHPGGAYPYAHLPQSVVDRMLKHLVGKGQPAITRADILQLSLVEPQPARPLLDEILTPSLLADILVAFDAAVERFEALIAFSDVGSKAKRSALLYRQLTAGEIAPGLMAEIARQVLDGSGVCPLRPEEREAILQELLARAMFVDLIELKAQDSATIVFLRHLLDTRYEGLTLRQHDSATLATILSEIRAIAEAHEDPRLEDADNVVVLRGFRK